MKNVSRREFIRTTSLIAATAPALCPGKPAAGAAGVSLKNAMGTSGPPQVHWLDGAIPDQHAGMAFGVPWPMGRHPAGTAFTARTPEGRDVPVQTWTTAIWPDGSLKWTGHALSPDTPAASYFEILPGKTAAPTTPVSIKRKSNVIQVDTGVMVCDIPTSGEAIIGRIQRSGRAVLTDGHLVGTRQASPDPGTVREAFSSRLQSVTVEQDGPIRAVIKLSGMHRTSSGREWLPFSIRLYFHSGSEAIRMTHTFIYDGDEHQDFISSLGVRFRVPMQDELYNRHIRFAGQDRGLWGEAVRGLTGLRRDAGKEVRAAQVAGQRVPDIHTWPKNVSTRVHWIPAWGDFTLSQPNANGFAIRKRTKPGHAWIASGQGDRSKGMGYVGGVSGGLAFGMRDFWKLHPTQLDIRDAATETAEVTLWMWSPEAPPMDIRFYHDGLGQDVEGPLPAVMIDGIDTSVPDKPYAKQLDALQITYEDYEPGFGTPYGVGRSTDIFLWAMDATPSRETFVALADVVATPPQLVARPGDLHRARVFSNMWNLPDRSSPNLSALEDRLDWSIDYYHKQVEQHQWYGFWDYGDVMHTYDRDRHVWRYDVGGYAWDNSELSTDMWLWYTFLRSGNSKAFRLAEAMNRHNRDVDIYHIGRFKGFGTRHNVQHWGCSAKQLRISTCMNRRFHYFLTTDERTGDVLQEVVEADRALATLNPVRKVSDEPFECRIGIGTDYGAAVSNWLTAWERTGDPKYRNWIEASMRSIGQSKWGFFAGGYEFDPETKAMTAPADSWPSASHLSIMFGLPEVVAELIDLFDIPEFKQAWLRYCSLCNAPRDVLDKELGERYRPPGFLTSHSRITAYAAVETADPELAARAVTELMVHEWGPKPRLETTRFEGPDVLNPVDEAAWVSTNDSAQWGLAAIQTAALVPAAVSEH